MQELGLPAGCRVVPARMLPWAWATASRRAWPRFRTAMPTRSPSCWGHALDLAGHLAANGAGRFGIQHPVALAWGRQGHPVVFGRTFWPELMRLTGDEGARSVLRSHRDCCVLLEVDDAGVLRDVDTPDALAARASPCKSGFTREHRPPLHGLLRGGSTLR